MNSSPSTPAVLVVGSGISGLACARALHDNGVTVQVVDRGRVVGGRLATKRLDDRPTDIGARYFTVPDGSDFAPVVDDWITRGLAREWTDTFTAIAPDGTRTTKSGPMRYSAPGGLRSLATDLADRLRADGVSVEQQVTVSAVSDDGLVTLRPADGASGSNDRTTSSDGTSGTGDRTTPGDRTSGNDRATAGDGASSPASGTRYDTVVLAMPDPQAARMLAPTSPAAATLQPADGWNPTLAVTLAWPDRRWPADLHGAFVDNSPVIAFIADDGDRRGDRAPVLVVHSTPEFARAHLEHPETGVAGVVDALREVLGISDAPTFTSAQRWTFSNPAEQHPEPFLLQGSVAVCGDAWGERSAVPTAWASGTALGHAIAVASR